MRKVGVVLPQLGSKPLRSQAEPYLSRAEPSIGLQLGAAQEWLKPIQLSIFGLDMA